MPDSDFIGITGLDPRLKKVIAILCQIAGDDDADAEEQVTFLERAAVCHTHLFAALVTAEALLLVAMREDLVFDKKTRDEIIAAHPGMKMIRDALVKASPTKAGA